MNRLKKAITLFFNDEDCLLNEAKNNIDIVVDKLDELYNKTNEAFLKQEVEDIIFDLDLVIDRIESLL